MDIVVLDIQRNFAAPAPMKRAKTTNTIPVQADGRLDFDLGGHGEQNIPNELVLRRALEQNVIGSIDDFNPETLALNQLFVMESLIPGAGDGLSNQGDRIKPGTVCALYTGSLLIGLTNQQVEDDIKDDYLLAAQNATEAYPRSNIIIRGRQDLAASKINDCLEADRKKGICSNNSSFAILVYDKDHHFRYKTDDGEQREVVFEEVPIALAVINDKTIHTGADIHIPYGKYYWSDKKWRRLKKQKEQEQVQEEQEQKEQKKQKDKEARDKRASKRK